MLDQDLKTQLSAYLEKLQRPIELVASLDDSDAANELDGLLASRSEIEIDDRGHTNLPGVFAAGDATTVPFKQIAIAMGAGSTAALSAFDHLIRTSAPAESEAQAA